MSLTHNDIHSNDFDLNKYTKPHTQKLGHFTHMAVFNTNELSRFGKQQETINNFGQKKTKKKIHNGSRGGQYYIHKGRKIYLK